MKRNWRYILMLGAALGMLAVLAGCAGGARKRVRPPTPARATSAGHPTPASADPTVELKGYRTTLAAGGNRSWELQAASMKADLAQGALVLTGVTCRMRDGGAETLHVTADAGKAVVKDTTISELSLSGHVRATAPARGMTLTADAFRWPSPEGKIAAEHVDWRGPGMRMTAQTGTFPTDLSRAQLRGKVHLESAAQ